MMVMLYIDPPDVGRMRVAGTGAGLAGRSSACACDRAPLAPRTSCAAVLYAFRRQPRTVRL